MKKIVLLLSVLLSTQLYSQTTDIVQSLDEVVVTATRSEILLEDSPIPTEVIGKKEIESLNLITMQDLLQAKGFQVAPMKSGGFQLRGLSSEYVLVMIDGVPIAGRESGALDLSNINLGNVERVEIVKGSMSSLWGNHAIGGVINIITKKGQMDWNVPVLGSGCAAKYYDRLYCSAGIIVPLRVCLYLYKCFLYYIGGVLIHGNSNDREYSPHMSFTSVGYNINRQGSHRLFTGTLRGSGLPVRKLVLTNNIIRISNTTVSFPNDLYWAEPRTQVSGGTKGKNNYTLGTSFQNIWQ